MACVKMEIRKHGARFRVIAERLSPLPTPFSEAHSRLDLTEPKYFLRPCAGWPHGFQGIPLSAQHSWSKQAHGLNGEASSFFPSRGKANRT